MSTPRIKNLLITLLALTTIAGGVLAWNQYRELIKLRAGAVDDPARADLQKRLWALEKRKTELEAEVADLRARENGGDLANAEGEEEGGPRAGAGEARRAGPFNRRGGGGGLTNLMDNPQFAKLWADQQKARINTAFSPLLKSLNLSPEQTDKLQALLAERQSSFMDALSAARSQGITGRDQIQQLVQQANSQIDGQIQALLGPDGYAQYNNYLQTMPQRNQVSQLQARLASEGTTPLQDFQSQQLTQILAQNSEAGAGGGLRGGGGFFGAMGGMGGLFGSVVSGPPISPNAVTQAAGLLTAQQLLTLQQMQQEQAAQQQLINAMRQNFRAGQSGGAGAGATSPATTVRPVARPGGG
jgi:hypothetical protein